MSIRGPNRVVFRQFGDGEVVALFPDEPGDCAGHTCMSYMHVGQHGAADPAHVVRQTRPAHPDNPELDALRRELQFQIGYCLWTFRRIPANSARLRRLALAEIAR